jgi:hypothetical protein
MRICNPLKAARLKIQLSEQFKHSNFKFKKWKLKIQPVALSSCNFPQNMLSEAYENRRTELRRIEIDASADLLQPHAHVASYQHCY